MPKPKPKERMSVTSLYLPLRVLKWIDDHDRRFSTFVREAVEEKIAREGGFEWQVEEKMRELTEMESKLESVKKELGELKVKQAEWQSANGERKLAETIETAILNVKYKDARECAHDLRSLKPEACGWEDWIRRVERSWALLKANNSRRQG